MQPSSRSFVISMGGQESERRRIAELFVSAFGDKLRVCLGSPDRALEFLTPHLALEHVLVARQQGQVVGIAGFHHQGSSLVDVQLSDVIEHYGWIWYLCRGWLLVFLDRQTEPDNLLMDGIAVAAGFRGMGVGSALLEALSAHAKALGKRSVRLDVIDTNPAARRLYEERGFVAVDAQDLWILKWIFGFQHATTMELRCDEQGASAG